MFQKFGSNLPQSLIDAATSISEAKVEPAKPDADAIARRKRLQALKDKQEDDAAEKSYKSDTGVRKVAGSSYGGAKQKDDDVNEEVEELDEISKSTYVSAMRTKTDPNDTRGNRDSDEIVNRAKKYHGDKFAKQLSNVGKSHWPKTYGKDDKEVKQGYDKLQFRKNRSTDPNMVTKSGKLTKTAQKGLKSQLSKEECEEEFNIVEFVEYINEMDESQLDEMINEVLGKSAKAGDWIHDFVHSDNPKFAGKSKAQRKKMALAAYYGKQRNEELKGNQHKIDANKNGKVDAHDFKLLRAKKKVNEESDDEHFEKQSKKMQDAINLHLRKGKSYKDAVESSKKHVKEDVELELILDLTEGKDEDDVPFDADKNPKKSAVAGKQGYGPSVAKHLARLGLKGAQKKKTNETLMGKAGATSEEVEIEESRGHKIIARKLADIDRRSSGIAPDYHDNAQTISDKLKDQHNINKVEIVTQKDTSASSQKPDVSHMDDKQDLNKKRHGYGNVVHNEETELDESDYPKMTPEVKKQVVAHLKKGDHEAAKQAASKAGYGEHFNTIHRGAVNSFHSEYDTKPSSHSDVHPFMLKHLGEQVELDEVSAEMLGRYSDKANKEYNSPDGKKKEQRKKGLITAYLKAKGRARVPATYKEEVEQIDELSKDTLKSYASKAIGRNLSDRMDIGGQGNTPKLQKRAKFIDKALDKITGRPKPSIDLGKVMPEEVDLDETAALDQYIKSMGYDPEHTPKDKKVMFSKTNAFKTWATSRSRQESKSPGQEDDVHMSPGATARE